MFEHVGVSFRVISWVFGQTTSDKTTVVMQGMSMNEEELYKVEAKIKAFALSEDVDCISVPGPRPDTHIAHTKEWIEETHHQ